MRSTQPWCRRPRLVASAQSRWCVPHPVRRRLPPAGAAASPGDVHAGHFAGSIADRRLRRDQTRASRESGAGAFCSQLVDRIEDRSPRHKCSGADTQRRRRRAGCEETLSWRVRSVRGHHHDRVALAQALSPRAAKIHRTQPRQRSIRFGTRLATDARPPVGNSTKTPFDEIAGWLTEAGFTNPRRLPAPGPAPLVPATRIVAGLLL